MRRCRALGRRDIPVSRCERERNVRILCRALCEHNPFAPTNFASYAQLELRAQKALIQYYLNDPVNPIDVRRGLYSVKDRKRALEVLSGRNLPYWYHLWLEKDAEGLSQTERWQRDGFKGLDADLETLIKAAGSTMRVTLIEVEDCYRPGEMWMRDLLSGRDTNWHFYSPEYSGKLPRYQPFLCRIYMSPLAWRMVGPPYMMWPDFGLREAKESFLEIVAHLGGPLEWDEGSGIELSDWLVRNLDEVIKVARMSVAERRRLAKLSKGGRRSSVDFKFPDQRVFEFPATGDMPFTPHSLTEAHLPSVFTHCWSLHEGIAELAEGVVAMEGMSCGRLLSGKGRVRFETIDHERFRALKGEVATILGADAQVIAEYEDPAVAELLNHLELDDNPLPPNLLRGCNETPSRFIPVLPPKPGKEGPLAVRRAALRWINEPQEILGGGTPLWAFSQFEYRPELMQAVKLWVRKLDEECLMRGRKRDDQQFLRMLGLDRELLNDRGFTKQILSRLLLQQRNRLLPLPLTPVREGLLTEEDAMARLATVMHWFGRNQIFDFLQPIQQISHFMREIAISDQLSAEGRVLFQRMLAFCWYALAGKAYWTPIEFRTTLFLANAAKYSEGFFECYQKNCDLPWVVDSIEWLEGCSQPHLAHCAMHFTGGDFYESKLIPNDGEVDNIIELIGLLTAFIDEFDHTMRTTTDADSVTPQFSGFP